MGVWLVVNDLVLLYDVCGCYRLVLRIFFLEVNDVIGGETGKESIGSGNLSHEVQSSTYVAVHEYSGASGSISSLASW